MNFIIYLIGFRGTGKLTIAKELAKLKSFKIIDNHYINDPILELYAGSKEIPDIAWQYIEDIRDVVFEAIKTSEYQNLIFTNELFEAEECDELIYKKVANLAQSKKSVLLTVILKCELHELEKRLTSKERIDSLKDSNVESIRNIYSNFKLISSKRDDIYELDVTSLSAKESAKKIMQILEGNLFERQKLK